MELSGGNLIGAAWSSEGNVTFQGFEASTGKALDPIFHDATPEEIDHASSLAHESFPSVRAVSPDKRAGFLRQIADNIEGLGDELVECACRESGLPAGRITAERGRTANQLRAFANLVAEGSWVEARIDRAIPDRAPLPKPDLRRMLIPMGPVVVFGASNFPLAFSVCGGDTASALAAGNPVVVKAHPAHPSTSELTAHAVLQAIRQCDMPAGVFSMLHGSSHDVGLSLVRHPHTRAVGFTGSLRAGRALMDAAAARPSPIPVFAEMGSVNPVFVLPEALKEKGDAVVEGLIPSITMGVGQFCTNPGLVIGQAGEPLDQFVKAAGKLIEAIEPGTMLHGGICSAYAEGCGELEAIEGVKVTAEAQPGDNTKAKAILFQTTGKVFMEQPRLQEEVFGPSSLVVTCADFDEMYEVASKLEGNLTATVHAAAGDAEQVNVLVDILECKVGRLLFGGYPTGVEVAPSMHHGGPYPATSDSRATSVGTAAIQRFARPICYQNTPEDFLPPELHDANSRGIWRLIDNELTREDC